MNRSLRVVRIPKPAKYTDTLSMQTETCARVATGQTDNHLFLLEHTPVITVPRQSPPEHILATNEQLAAKGIDLCQTNRGGDVTYHGPGQLVAYPILDLNNWRKSIKWYLRTLEEVIINVLAGYEIQAERSKGLTGVWVGDAKVAALGISIRKWTTMHGVSINLVPDMSHFDCIVPCGIKDRSITSLSKLMATEPTMDQLMTDFEKHFIKLFEIENSYT